MQECARSIYPLNSDVTIHIAGTTATQTGGTAVLYGGQSFYFTAPLNGSSDMPLTNVTGSQCGRFTALAIKLVRVLIRLKERGYGIQML